VSDDRDHFLVYELVRYRYSLFGICLVIAAISWIFFPRTPPRSFHSDTASSRSIPEINAHFALVTRHGSGCADPDDVLLLPIDRRSG